MGCPRLGGFPSPPFPSVSKAFQQQQEVQLPLLGLAGGGSAEAHKDKHGAISNLCVLMLKNRPNNPSSHIPNITDFPPIFS